MSLMFGLALRLVAVAVLALAGVGAWIAVDSARALHRDTVASAERVAAEMTRRQGLASAAPAGFTDGAALSSLALIGPGLCVEILADGALLRRLCSGVAGAAAAPALVGRALALAGPADPAVRRPVGRPDAPALTVVATPDPVAAAARVWGEARLAFGLAVAMTVALTLLSALAILEALAPVRGITRALRLLADGRLSVRLPAYRTAEFRAIAGAFNHMADRLEATAGERTDLTQRLFEVQENERRTLARDLHDEFGQCLAAAAALAASIEAADGDGRAGVVEEARAISAVVRRMMATLRSALARLRPPEIDELGLAESLRTMVAGWNARLGGSTRVELVLDGGLHAVPPEAALNLYRIAQEAITNAVRHGRPSRIVLTVSLTGATGGDVTLSVVDDGGGDPLRSRPGFGLLGIRERIQLIGGRLTIGAADGGFSLSATVPLPGAAPQGAAA